MRKIIHVDMDAFYAAVEQRDDPALRGKPLVVGGDPDGRGVVATASYEARVFGIRSAMSCARARRLCPDALFVRPRFEAYQTVSRQIRAIFARYTDAVEPLSLDEAYLDVSASTAHRGSATRIAAEIKARIRAETGLTGSAGVSYNKLLAKLASDVNKPDGLYVITPEAGPAFAAALPVGRFHGIGRATEARMHALGIRTGAELARYPLERLQQSFGKAAHYYQQAARGIDLRPVVSHRERKSIGSETTFADDLLELPPLLTQLRRLGAEVLETLTAKHLTARTVTVKVKYADFSQVTRSLSVAPPLGAGADLDGLLARLLGRTEAGTRAVRLVGVSVSGLAGADGDRSASQLELF